MFGRRRLLFSWVILLAGACCATTGVQPAEAADAERVEFNRDIRPLLADRCFPCHGPDAGHRKAGLRLDTDQGAKADLGGRKAIVPGKPAESELLDRITSAEKARRMPPMKTGKELSVKEI